MKKVKIKESVFSDEFKEGDLLNTFLLNDEDASLLWIDLMESSEKTYFKFDDSNWISSGDSKIAGSWIDDYNSNCIDNVKHILVNEFNWSESDIIYFCISKTKIIESNWGEFLNNWPNFIECDDDCPIIINPKDLNYALMFQPIGNISILLRSEN